MSALLGMPGELVTMAFRGSKITVLAAPDHAAQESRGPVGPVTDPFSLELLSGDREAPNWPSPVVLNAIVEGRADPLLAVTRASRWASYAARVAIVPAARLNQRALLEAQLRGVWVIAASTTGQARVEVHGERGPTAGAIRGLVHRWLDELVWAEMLTCSGQSDSS
jgi:hypothetical protein